MPPSGFSKESVESFLNFIRCNYKDLQQEVQSGKHASFEAAIDHEISQLGKALTKLHINDEGELVERS